MPVSAAAAVGLAVALDLAVAEFPEGAHPVAWYGRLVGAFDREWSRPRLLGLLAAAGPPLLAAVTVGLAVAAAGRLHPVAGTLLAGVALFATISLRMLLGVAREVIAASAGDLEAARERLPALAGRDASSLSPGEVRSAAVESLAENLADGFVAGLLAFALLAPVSLAAGAAGAAWVKAVNTNDSMLGYRSKPVGWASARLDDAVMWLPARVSALLLAIAAGDPGAVLRARAWARAPPSPNSGWPMATLAAALGVRLTKPGAYTLNPGAALPTTDDAERGARIVGVAGALAAVGAGVLAWF